LFVPFQAATEVFGTSREAPVTFGKPVFAAGGRSQSNQLGKPPTQRGGGVESIGASGALLKSKIKIWDVFFVGEGEDVA